MQGDPDLKAWPVVAILVIQVILFLEHWFVYSTFVAFWPGLTPAAVGGVRTAMLVLAFSFVAASLLSFRFYYPFVRFYLWSAVVWVACVGWFLWASVVIRLVWLA